MDWVEAATTLGGAIIGALAAIGAAGWSLRRATDDSRAESRSAERSSLEALALEIGVVEEIAREHSVTPLPTQMLITAFSGIHHMGGTAKEYLVEYSAAVQRYNGRVQRLVAYGAAKRAAGQSPGAEKIDDKHVQLALSSAKKSLAAVEKQLGSSRLRSPAVNPAVDRGQAPESGSVDRRTVSEDRESQ
jgi:hypothetical protein